MFCPKCGSEVQEGSAFCGKCGTPVGGAQQAAPSGAAAQGAGVPAQKKGSTKIGIIAAAVVVVVVLVAGFATNWFGLAGVQPKEAMDVSVSSGQAADDGAKADDAGAAEPEADIASEPEADSEPATDTGAATASVEDYTWDELSQISGEIAAAGDEAAAIEVAKKYNLCTPDGKLDGTQIKSVTLADGTQTTVQIVGFAHDDKTSGGKAGITFIFGDCIAEASMNASDTSAGGWEMSALRASLNSAGVALLPSDLAAVVVPVDKLTNNVGVTESVSSVTTTSDKLWLFSATELCGAVDWSTTQAYDDVLNAEGSEYKLFRDTAVKANGVNNMNDILVKNYEGSSTGWWERSPHPIILNVFYDVGSVGYPNGDGIVVDSYGVVPGFCI